MAKIMVIFLRGTIGDSTGLRPLICPLGGPRTILGGPWTSPACPWQLSLPWKKNKH